MGRTKKINTKTDVHALAAPVRKALGTVLRVEAGRERALQAKAHLYEARKHLDAACADLSSVIGASDIYRAIARLSDAIKTEIYTLDEAAHDAQKPLVFDRDPTERDLKPHAGCGVEVPS